MIITIDDEQLEQQLQERLGTSGQSADEFVTSAVREKLTLTPAPRHPRSQVSAEELKAIQDRVAALPVLDPRTPDEIIGYDEWGLPTL